MFSYTASVTELKKTVSNATFILIDKKKLFDVPSYVKRIVEIHKNASFVN